MNTVASRRPSLVRQMALRTSSTGSEGGNEGLPEGFAVRQGHLAAPVAVPDSPRPQKTANASENTCLTTTLTVPADKPAAAKSPASKSRS
ncbi:hypothetical protein M3Y99_00186500 [Aphelenchoides fujianensis]|nr:hypothetical protein M3Y99_00186500 [Aphelenchoides fujianensis]